MFNLDGKIALVTGGNGGIGREIVLALAAVGASVVSCDISEELGEFLCKQMREVGLSVEFKKLDVTNSLEVDTIMDSIVEEYGTLDILVNSAGVLGDNIITQLSDNDWERVLKVNLDGSFYTCRKAVSIMEEKRSGKIINIASVGGKLGFKFAGVNYCSSKGGIMALTRQLALQVGANNINVNAVAPVTTRTDMIKNRPGDVIKYIEDSIPMGKMATTKDTASAVVFLASDSSNYITGETIDVNGGLYMD